MIDFAQYAGTWGIYEPVARAMRAKAQALVKIPAESIEVALRNARAECDCEGDPCEDCTGGDIARSLIQRRGRVTEVSIRGVLYKDPLLSRELFGMPPTYGEAAEAVRMAAADDSEEVLLIVDSGGGSINGLALLLEALGELRAQKRVTAYVDDLAASAAYWAIAHGADEIVAGPLSYAGSIGVFVLLLDESAADEAAGLDWTLVSSGGVKGLGADGRVPPALVKKAQALVDDTTTVFVEGVAAGRGLAVTAVRKLADGDIHRAPAALELGLIDRVETLEQVRSRLAGKEQEDDVSEKNETPAPAGTVVEKTTRQAAEPGADSGVSRFMAHMRTFFAGDAGVKADEAETRAALAAAQHAKDAGDEIAKLRATVEEMKKTQVEHAAKAEAAEKKAKAAEVKARVDADIAALGEVPPATLKSLRPSMEAHLAAGEEEQYKALLEVARPMAGMAEFLGAPMAEESDSGERLAGDRRPADVRATDEKFGISAERAVEIANRYRPDYRDVN